MGAVGLAIWVPSVTNQPKETEPSEKRTLARGYSTLSNEDDGEILGGRIDGGNDLELCVVENASEQEAINEDLILEDLKVSRAMSKNYVKVTTDITLKEAINRMHESKQNCVLLVTDDDLLEGILTYGDIRRLSKKSTDASKGDSTVTDVNTHLVSSVCTRGITYRGQGRGLLTCYPDTDLAIAKELMEAKEIKQLPVVKRHRAFRKERKRKVIAILQYDSILNCLREEINRRKSIHQHRKESNLQEMIVAGH